MASGAGWFAERWRGRDSMVLILTLAASGVDAISYLGLGHVFTANMTGNAVLLGLAVGQGKGLAALRSILALLGFVVGVTGGAILVQRGPHEGDWPPAVHRAIAAEGAVLAAFTLVWHLRSSSADRLYPLIVLSAIAMGMQSAAIRHLNLPGVATTYITGTLTSLVASFVKWLHVHGVAAAIPELAPALAPAATQAERRHAARLQAGVFLVYVAAAGISGFLQVRQSRLVSFLPLLAVILVIANGIFRPRPGYRPNGAGASV